MTTSSLPKPYSWRWVLALVWLNLMLGWFVQSTSHSAAAAATGFGVDAAEVTFNGCQMLYNVQCDEVDHALYEKDAFNMGVDRLVAKVFSSTVCKVEEIVTDVFGNMWCQVSAYMLEPLSALLILYIAILGLGYATGLMRLSLPDLAYRTILALLVWGFVTKAELALDLMFTFYMTLLKEGLYIVFSWGPSLPGSPSYGGAQSVEQIMYNLDIVAGDLFSGPEDEMVTIIASVFALVSSVPGGVMLGSALFAEGAFTFFVFCRTVLSYLISITAMTFLLTLSPIFISLALFGVTRRFFWNWLDTITSFALQPIIIFAYIVMMERYLNGVKETIGFDLSQFHSLMVCFKIDGVDNMMVGNSVINANLPQIFFEPTHAPPECGESTVTAFDYNWKSNSNSEAGLEKLYVLVVAGLLIDFVTLEFLSIVPDLAQEITSSGRVLRVGASSAGSKGGALSLPGQEIGPSVYEGIVQATRQGGKPEDIARGALQGARGGVIQTFRNLNRS
jgi:hypothetical protein